MLGKYAPCIPPQETWAHAYASRDENFLILYHARSTARQYVEKYFFLEYSSKS